jgi:hypothetical protein
MLYLIDRKGQGKDDMLDKDIEKQGRNIGIHAQ